MEPQPKMYGELADWWQLISPVQEYQEEAEFFMDVLRQTGLPPNATMLELGSGGGSNAHYLKSLFAQVTLTDLSPGMLEVSRTLNPDCEHLLGDMRTQRLGRTFDVVFVHDAVEYMTTHEALQQALATAAVHCKPGGVALFVPDHVRESFEPETEVGGTDGEERSLRFLEWSYDPDENDTEYITEYVYLLREGSGTSRVEYDLHRNGVFPRSEWLSLLTGLGFTTEIVRDSFGRDLFVARNVK